MLQTNFFNTIFVFPILNLLVFFYKGFLLLKIPGAFGFAIIALTVFIRFLSQPIFQKQLEISQKMQDLKPSLDKLAKKYKNDQKTLQQEQLKLYQQKGINPAYGCLLPFIQLPFFIALYNTLSLFLIYKKGVDIFQEINKVLYFPFLKIYSVDLWFFGFNLTLSPKQAGEWYYLLIPLITGVLQYFQAISMTPAQENKRQSLRKTVFNKDSLSNSSTSNDDFQKAMNTQMKVIFSLMIGFFSYTLPVGLSLYWNIFSLFSIIQLKKMEKNKSKIQSSNIKSNLKSK